MSDVAKWKTHGPVRVLRREHAEWDPDHGTWKPARGVSIVTFRPDGQMSEGESHNPDGSIARWAHVYDDRARLIESQSWMDEGPRRSVFYSCDARGRPTAAVEVAPDGTRRESEACKYDDAGRKTKVCFLPAYPTDIPNRAIVDLSGALAFGVEGTEHSYGAPGATTSTVVYDDRELPAEVSFHDANHALVRRIVFSRDRDGRVLTEVVYFGGELPFPDILTRMGTVPLEERAKLAGLMKIVFANQVFASVDYSYDGKGRLLEKTMRMGTLSEERTTFRYDDRDDPIAEISEHRRRGMGLDDTGAPHATEEEPLGQHNRYEYHYDARGNWTERVVWIRPGSQPDFQCSNVERRTITYWEL